MDDPNMHDYGTHYKIDDAEEILKAVELMTSLFSSSEVIAIFSEHAPVWTRDAKAWIEQNAWRLHG